MAGFTRSWSDPKGSPIRAAIQQIKRYYPQLSFLINGSGVHDYIFCRMRICLLRALESETPRSQHLTREAKPSFSACHSEEQPQMLKNTYTRRLYVIAQSCTCHD